MKTFARSGDPSADLAVAVEHLVDEGRVPIRREQSCPLDEGRRGEVDKRIARLEVPLLLLHIEALDAQAAVLGERAVGIGREVEYGGR